MAEVLYIQEQYDELMKECVADPTIKTIGRFPINGGTGDINKQVFHKAHQQGVKWVSRYCDLLVMVLMPVLSYEPRHAVHQTGDVNRLERLFPEVTHFFFASVDPSHWDKEREERIFKKYGINFGTVKSLLRTRRRYKYGREKTALFIGIKDIAFVLESYFLSLFLRDRVEYQQFWMFPLVRDEDGLLYERDEETHAIREERKRIHLIIHSYQGKSIKRLRERLGPFCLVECKDLKTFQDTEEITTPCVIYVTYQDKFQEIRLIGVDESKGFDVKKGGELDF